MDSTTSVEGLKARIAKISNPAEHYANFKTAYRATILTAELAMGLYGKGAFDADKLLYYTEEISDACAALVETAMQGLIATLAKGKHAKEISNVITETFQYLFGDVPLTTVVDNHDD
jgi:hypothetical protein